MRFEQGAGHEYVEEVGGAGFFCQKVGFESVGEAGGLLGAFDGGDRRVVRIDQIRSSAEQLLVSAHEQMHHELQWSTAWGVTAAMSSLLAEAGIRPATLSNVALIANEAARNVHEVFATTISCGVLGVPESRLVLGDNDRYVRYLNSGLMLGGPVEWPWQFRESAIQMLLRSLMQPVELLDVAEKGFAGIRVRDIADVSVQPDARLRTIADLAPAWWGEVFAELSSEFPDRGGDTGGLWERNLPETHEAMDALKTWEESTLIPRLANVASVRLSEVGIRVLDGVEYLGLAEALQASFVSLGPEDWEVSVLTGPRRLTDEPLGAEREALQFREEPWPARVVEEHDLVDNATHFLSTEFLDEPYIVALFAEPAVYRHQLAGFEWLGDEGGVLLSMVGAVNLEGPGASVPVAMMQPGVSPQALAQMFTSLPVLTVTTLSTTRESQNRRAVLDLDQVFIVIDLPLRLQIEQWIATGWAVRFAAIELESDRSLTLLLFEIDELPNCTFLTFRSRVGYGEIAQLMERHGEDRISPGLRSTENRRTASIAVASRLLNSWWEFRETGW